MAMALNWEPRCLHFRVSVVNERWGLVWATNGPQCPKADGVVALKRIGEFKWRIRYQGPADPWAPCSTLAGRVPDGVARDLRLCGKT